MEAWINIVPFNYQKPAIIKMLFGIGGGEQEVVSQEVDSLKLGQETFKKISILNFVTYLLILV